MTPDRLVITFRVAPEAMDRYRKWDGKTMEIPRDTWIPQGLITFCGVPGRMSGDVFEVTGEEMPPPPPDPGPPWAQAMVKQLDEILRRLGGPA